MGSSASRNCQRTELYPASHFRECDDEMVDVGTGVEGAGADADEAVGIRAECFMDVRRAVKTGPDGDVERLIQDRAEIGRRHGLAAEADRADAASGIRVAEDLEASHSRQRLPQTVAQF